jgi:DNA-binding transcriptional MerR regulator
MYGMKETCEKVGLNYSTLKFYCNEGLIPNVKRDKNNRRIFDDENIKWIKGLTCLKNCNLSIDEMKIYIAMMLKGNSTIPERKKLLAQKQMELKEKIATLEEAVAFIDWKQNFYNDILNGKIDY